MKPTTCLLFRASIVLLMLAGVHPVIGQISIDTTFTPEELVQDYLVGSGVTVSNVMFNGISGDQINRQLGLYSGPSNFVEFDEGLALATTVVDYIATGIVDLGVTFCNDPDLYALANVGGTSNSVFDCAILEFDFVPDFEFLTVGYVFGSSEYPDYTCSNYNDVFGFFVSGPGISGPYTNEAINIAVIPNTTIPVGINTVNGGVPSGGETVQNCLDANPNFVDDSIYFVSNNPTLEGDVRFPGMTTNLYANYILEAGETYHIKLAIANSTDGLLDSGVLLEGASFSAFPLSGNEDIAFSSNAIEVFPNPAGEHVNLSFTLDQPAQIMVQITDVTGKTVLEPIGAVQVEERFDRQIDLSSLQQGTYFLKVINLDTKARHISRVQTTH